eukprot:SAG11_NODE_2881_length_2872_cov_2.463397_1_plen_55_part_00
MTEPIVASRSEPVRHKFAQLAIHCPQPVTLPQDSTDWTIAQATVAGGADRLSGS